jgi:FixJ family two-component response regulator
VAEPYWHGPGGTTGALASDRLQSILALEIEEKDRAGIRILIIFMTGYGDISMTVKAMKAGAVEFLAKPFSDQDLLDAVPASTATARGARATRRCRGFNRPTGR